MACRQKSQYFNPFAVRVVSLFVPPSACLKNSTFASRALCTFFANSFTRFRSLREPGLSTPPSCVLHILNVEGHSWQKVRIDFCGRAPWWRYRISDRRETYEPLYFRCTVQLAATLCGGFQSVYSPVSAALSELRRVSTVSPRPESLPRKERVRGGGRGRGQLTTPLCAAAGLF